MNTLTDKQLEQKAEEFVGQYRNASDDEISKIVAGMTAIIEGNEASYEAMKNQKWFERIWYGLTLKNKATVKEMQSKRELLTKYTVQILVKMNDLMNEHSECIHDLYRALAVVRRDLDFVVDEVNLLAHKLNEKIISVDSYYYLITEIQNKKFNTNTPLLSLIEIMSLIDSRTANETSKLIQLKETMENAGFDFSTKVDIPTYSEEIFALPEEKVGRILLFCQSFSNRSRFLAYTCSLMENYFYLGDCDRQFVRESGEAVENALIWSSLTNEMSCDVEGMFNDIKNYLPDSFKQIEISAVVSNNNQLQEDDTTVECSDTIPSDDCIVDSEKEEGVSQDSTEIKENAEADYDTSYGEIYVDSIVHIKLGETLKYINKTVYIRSLINCEGELIFDNCTIYCDNISGGSIIMIGALPILSILNSNVICNGNSKRYFITDDESGICSKVLMENSTFSECKYFLSLTFPTINIIKCEIKNCGIKFLDVNCPHEFEIANCNITIEHTDIDGKVTDENHIIHISVPSKDSVKFHHNTVVESGVDGKLCLFHSDTSGYIYNCTFTGLKNGICASSYQDNTFINCNSCIGRNLSSIFVKNCRFDNCTNTILLSPFDSTISHCDFKNCAGTIISCGNYAMVGEAEISYCEFNNIKATDDAPIILVSPSMEKYKRNKIVYCIFYDIVLHNGFLLKPGTCSYKLNRCTTEVLNCSFKNISTSRQDRQVIQTLAHYDGIFKKNLTCEAIKVTGCTGV